MNTEHQAIKPDGNVEFNAGGVRVSVPAALLVVALTALGSAGATKALTPGSEAATGAQTAAVQALSREMITLQAEVRGLTQTVNQNADACATGLGRLESRVDKILERKTP